MMRIGLLGAGSIGARHVAAFREAGAQVAHVASRSRAGADAFATQHAMTACDGLAQLLPLVDAVVIATPTDGHAQQARDCLAAGVPVLCEKPLTRHVDEARALLQFAATTGVPLLPLHVVRWFAPYVAMHTRATRGEIGKVETLALARHGQRPTREGGSWFDDAARAGGVMFDLLIHDMDYARWVCGPVRSVRAQLREQDVAEIAMLHRNGVVTHIDGSWTAPRFRTEAHIFGSAGMLDLDVVAEPNAPDPYVAQARDMLAALTSRQPIRVTAQDGLAAVALAAAALRSAETDGAEIAIPPDID
jgi:predicted dehydrogenase